MLSAVRSARPLLHGDVRKSSRTVFNMDVCKSGKEKDRSLPLEFSSCCCCWRTSARNSLALLKNGAIVARTCWRALASRTSGARGVWPPGVAACKADTSSLMVRPPSPLCGSTSSTTPWTSTPSAKPRLSNTSRSPSMLKTSLCFAGGNEAKASATCACNDKHRRRRSSSMVDGAKMRMPRTNSTGSRMPSLSTSTSWKRVFVSPSVSWTLCSNSWKAAGVFFCKAESMSPPCMKT
mmetsp:Transcript_128985/g.373193  ORF Transcript_128985/g.373193 Transcript_128985/m.373193 type:complete len:236 (+) Transcript_128985:392-1099(+)